MKRATKHKGFWREHSLSIVTVTLLVFWIVAYSLGNPDTHWGSFFGNAIADWSGSVVMILGTKFMIEVGSAQSNPEKKPCANPLVEILWRHSLLIFLFVTGLGWAFLYSRMEPNGKWGQVVGNIVSEWLQMAGLVFLTKRLVERGSK
jgi:membrane protease YdiL (CAAX protease family)